MEEAIVELLDRYERAIREKDSVAAVACYARDITAYDLAPPLAIGSASAANPVHLDHWFATWDGPISSVAKHMHIRSNDDLAYAFTLRHMTGRKKSGELVDLWFRATATMAREDGVWKITHIHNSVPFAMDGSGKAELNLKP